MNTAQMQHNQRGFALLVVLWTVALLALLGTYLVVAARDRMVMANDQRIAATLEAAADGATQHAIFALLKGQWTTDGTVRAVRIGAAEVSVFLEDEALKLNLNFASAQELQAILQQLSVNRQQAGTLAAAIVNWRTPGGAGGMPAAAGDPGRNDPAPGIPFVRLEDLAAVPGMTPDIMQRLRPHLTLFTGADPDVVPATGSAGGVQVIGIVAIAHGRGRAMFARHIIVRTNARRSGRRYEILMSDRDAAMPELHPGTEQISVSP
jgi:general secretion pathway protein K